MRFHGRGGSSFSLEAAFGVISSQVFKQMSAFYINQPGPVTMIFRKKSQVTVSYHVTICCCACSTSEARLERRVHGCRFPCGGAQNDCTVSSFCFNDRNIYYRHTPDTPDLQNNLLLDLIASFKNMIKLTDVLWKVKMISSSLKCVCKRICKVMLIHHETLNQTPL